MDTKEAFDLYQLAKTNIYLESAEIEAINVNKEVSQLEGDYIKEITFGKKTEYINEKEIYGYLRVEVLCKKSDSKKVDLQITTIHRGHFVSKESVDKGNLEDWTEIQIIPQLLPYSRSLISSITSQMSIPPIMLPTMDILESIKVNRNEDLDGED